MEESTDNYLVFKHNRVSQAKLSPAAVAICDIYIVCRSVLHQRFFYVMESNFLLH